MLDTDYFGFIIEFSIGLAGFSAIVTAFMHQSGGGIGPVDRFRISNMLALAFLPAFLSFLYLGLQGVIGAGMAARVISGLHSIVLFIILMLAFKAISRIHRITPEAINTTVFVVVAGVSSVLIVVQALSAMGTIQQHLFALYFCLVVTLMQGAVMFVRILFGDRKLALRSLAEEEQET